MMGARPLVLFTDFGSTDFYAGVMRAVLVTGSPASRIIDLHHDLPAHDIAAASFVLARSFDYLPPDAVVVVVADPGVGTERRGLIVSAGGRTLVGPDNGFASDLLVGMGGVRAHAPSFVVIDEASARRESGIEAQGPTFHGRDIFAPVASAIARGGHPDSFGAEVSGIAMLHDIPSVSIDGGFVSGRGRYVDHFGNILTDIPRGIVHGMFEDPARVAVFVSGQRAGSLRETYADGEPGQLIALVNSWGLVEAAVNSGRAIDYFEGAPPASIRFELRAAETRTRG
jgi:S-adenosyl-L-methionine hydrolase (adenosine-forming)